MTFEPETVESLVLNTVILCFLISIVLMAFLVFVYRRRWWFVRFKIHAQDLWDKITLWWWKRRYR
jgi:hypothetical protein